MGIKHAMWIHGHSIQLENVDGVDSCDRKGFYVRVTGKNNDAFNWFHFAIPTPVIVDSQRLKLGSVLVRFRTGGAGYSSVELNSVHVYDGENKIQNASKDKLLLKPHNWHVERINLSLPLPEIKWGVGISIGVKFVAERSFNPLQKGYIDFSSAGCDFMS